MTTTRRVEIESISKLRNAHMDRGWEVEVLAVGPVLEHRKPTPMNVWPFSQGLYLWEVSQCALLQFRAIKSSRQYVVCLRNN